MKNSIIKKLLNEGVVSLYCDYRSGHANDFSPLARHGVITAPVQFGVNGASFQGAGKITHPDHASGRNTTGSVVILTKPATYPVSENGRLFSARETETRIDIFYTSLGGSGVSVFDGAGAAGIAFTTAGKQCIGVNYTSGANLTTVYADGVLVGPIVKTCSYNAPAVGITIGNYYAGSYACPDPIAAVIETSRILTASEHSQLFFELQNMKWPTKPLTNASSNNVLYGRTRNVHLEGSPVSVAVRGGTIGQYLENTPFQFGDATGRYSISTATIFGKTNQKTIKCGVAGLLYMPSTQAYGLWEFDFFKGGDTNVLKVALLADTIGAVNAAGQDGYWFYFGASEELALQESTNGTVSDKFYTANSYCAINTWYRIQITRTAAGIFTVKIKGGAFTGWTTVAVVFGTNPVTDTTTTTSLYNILDLGVNDQIANLVFKPLA